MARRIKKTTSFAAIHFAVAFGVSYLQAALSSPVHLPSLSLWSTQRRFSSTIGAGTEYLLPKPIHFQRNTDRPPRRMRK